MIYHNTGFSSDRILRQRLVIEEFGTKLVYVPGVKNTVADVLSQLDTGADELNEKEDFFGKDIFKQVVIRRHD